MKKILLTTTGLIALGMAPAIAADLPARAYTKAPPMAVAVYNWGGFYAGVNGGWGSSRNRWDETSLGVALSMGSHDATGGTVGGQIGYRWQAASWVFGVEAQGNWADFHGSNAIPLVVPSITNDTRVDAFGLFTGQVGYAANNVLFYVKGGAAVTSNRYRMLATGTGVQLANSVDETRWGGVVGVGLEYGFAPNWSAGIEYNHMFMQDKTYNFVSNGAFVLAPAGSLLAQSRIRQDVDVVTARINYKFGAY
ncbi:porin family protein [Bradyrhizobium sp. 190]|uniref:outer membrane protein n=1 Tax=Bradyrhizobium sp. 190 TaxID=2782658 RepID=UPI001FFA2369|nr:outer membrane beta-barrel protein [Bradyrhizobium sp. 190]MCK1517403.1 porin family protein [Bradyrhizobium sp. 190]